MNTVFKGPVVLMYLLYTYISVFKCNIFLVTLLPHYTLFQLFTAIITYCLLAEIIALHVKIITCEHIIS
jgi:hypothetical protein